MDDEWDLHAVVRSCTTASAASSAATTAAAAVDDDEKFQSFSFQSDENLFLYPSFMENQSSYRNEGLEEIYRESYSLPPLITATMSAGAATVGNPVQEEGAYDRIFQDSHIFAIQGMNSQSNRYRKRKNQQKKIVRQMTQEELSNDSWAWRKYGQKPIKGSPYPRNYYRCSTSKGCGARKQVERSPTDPTIFIVSYTGEHTHPRPTHRSSLAGSTRSKNTSTTENKTPAMISGNTSYNPLPPCSSSSPVSASSFSPPIVEEEEEEEEEVGGEMTQRYNDGDGDGGGDEDEILIPNITVTEEILKGFQELNTGRGGFFSPPPPWPPGYDC